MKVCTDATLFGAMAPVSRGVSVLDIGGGTGLLSLMAAQLGAGRITAIEVVAPAASEAAANFLASPWCDRLISVQGDIRDFARSCATRFDLLISNPPFFADHTRSSELFRRVARHGDDLSLAQLAQAANALLSDTGLFYVLLPTFRATDLLGEAALHGLHLLCRADIRSFAHAEKRLSAMTLARFASEPVMRDITIYDAPRIYTETATHYLGSFLLRFADRVD